MTAIRTEFGSSFAVSHVPYVAELGPAYSTDVFTEMSNPDGAMRAQMIHAESYVKAGFVIRSAVVTDGMTNAMLAEGRIGRLPADMDHARGPHVDYYTTERVGQPRDEATLRKINLTPGQSYEDLPAAHLSRDALTPLGRRFLNGIQDQELRMKEIGALGLGAHGRPLTAHAVIRQAVHDAMGKNEIWFSTLVAPTHESLVQRFGAENLKVIGHNIRIDDPRVSPKLELKPIILRPDTFLDNLAESYQGAKDANDAAAQKRFGQTLSFFSEGLDITHISPGVFSVLGEIRHSRAVAH